MRGILLSAFLCLTASHSAFGATRAMVIGIDDYPHEVSLEGAARDARDVASALQGAGVAEIVTFYNADARKDDIRAAWERLVAGSVEGDTIVLTYAGHGSQMPELVTGDEEDGLDEFLQLPGFDRARASDTEHEIIVDNELNAWFSEAEARGVRVLFVSDSCHSGGMSRAFNGRTRLAPAVTVKLSPPSQEATGGAVVREADFRQVTVLAASLESQPSPEVIIEGEPRGALSWSFARAIEGAADRNGDGRISRIELEDYVFANVKHQSEALQVPNFTPQLPRSADEVMLPIGALTAARKGGGKTAAELGWQDRLALNTGRATVQLQHIGGSGVPYRWDAESGVFYTPNGDVAAEHVDTGTVQGVVDKFVLLDFLKILASRNPGSVSLAPQKDIYAKGDRIAFEAPASRYRNTIVFNLANTGEVQLLDVQAQGTESHLFKLTDIEVVAPFGADHLVVISTDEPIDAIAALLGQKRVDAADLLQLVLSRLDGTDTAVAIQPLYTREKL